LDQNDRTISVVVLRSKTKEAQSWFSEGFPEENWCPNLSQRKRAVFGTFSPLFPEKGQGRDTRKVFRRKTAPFLRDRLGYKFSNKNKEKGQFSFGKVPENLNLVSFQKMVDKKNLFETKNANLTKNAKHFLFQKGFFCQPFFEKTQTLHFLFQKGFFCQPFFEKILFVCVVALPSKRFFFVNHFLKRYFLFVSWPSLQIPFLLGKPSFSPLFPEKGQGRDTRLENNYLPKGDHEIIHSPTFRFYLYLVLS
jgi:hypothetical protein